MAKHSLPPVKVLFKDSWETFKGSVLNLFIINVVTFAIIIGLFVVSLLIALPFGAFSIFNAISTKTLNPAFYSSLGVVGLIILVFIIVCMVVSFAVQAATILVTGNYKSKPKAIESIKKGFGFAWRIFLAGLLMGFIIAGGYFLFVIPGIFFAVIFSFAFYEIVLNKQGVTNSLRRSSQIVMSNFWGIFWRITLWVIIVILISFIPQLLIGSTKSAALGGSWSLISSILNVLLSWYGICYSITLYKQASVGMDTAKGNKLMWPIIAAVVGWIVGIITFFLIMAAIVALIATVSKSATQKKMMNAPSQTQMNNTIRDAMANPNEANMNKILKLIPTSSPEYIKFKQEINKEFHGTK